MEMNGDNRKCCAELLLEALLFHSCPTVCLLVCLSKMILSRRKQFLIKSFQLMVMRKGCGQVSILGSGEQD